MKGADEVQSYGTCVTPAPSSVADSCEVGPLLLRISEDLEPSYRMVSEEVIVWHSSSRLRALWKAQVGARRFAHASKVGDQT